MTKAFQNTVNREFLIETLKQDEFYSEKKILSAIANGVSFTHKDNTNNIGINAKNLASIMICQLCETAIDHTKYICGDDDYNKRIESFKEHTGKTELASKDMQILFDIHLDSKNPYIKTDDDESSRVPISVSTDDLQEALLRNKLPLPHAIYPDADCNTNKIFEYIQRVNPGLINNFSIKDIHDWVDENNTIHDVQQLQVSSDEIIPFITDKGADWGELTISFVDRETVRIKYKNTIEIRTYREMGFFNNKTEKEPVKSWLFFECLAMEYGTWPPNGSKRCEKFKNPANTISILRGKLSQVFQQIEGDPFYKHHTKYGYSIKITLRHECLLNA